MSCLSLKLAALALFPTLAWAPVTDVPRLATQPAARKSFVNEELVALQLQIAKELTPVAPGFTRVWAKVTACSPSDPADVAYYSKYGYEGAKYNIAACYSQLPKGTLIRVPGYLDKTYPNKFWEVDSRGGSVIRRSARAGVVHIDVKFATLYSARAWGTRWMHIDVIYPD